jgi:pimeloyl-ACP methyl ester carboxylesterase
LVISSTDWKTAANSLALSAKWWYSGPSRLWLATRPLRWTAVRHSPLGYGPFVTRPLDAALTRRWVTPLLTDAGVRKDTARFMRAMRPASLLDVSTRLGNFTRPVLLLWGTGDRLVEVEDGHTFLPLGEPDRIASEISTFLVPA